MPITMYGTYWCSDCKRTRQAASAAGEGAAVALGVRQYLEPRVQNPAEMATAAD